MKTVIKDFSYRDEHFVIVQDENKKFWAINKEWIDENGKLNRSINGADGNRADTIEKVIESVTFRLDIKHYMSKGLTIEEAFRTVTA